MKEYRPNLDLTKPAEARKFFREFRWPDDKPMEQIFHLQKGLICPLLLNDREVCEVDISINHSHAQHGFGYFVPE
jgi:hypothetical protein